MAQGEVERISFDDGAGAVELAREAVETYVLKGHRRQLGSMREAFYLRRPALVRLIGAGGRLRGCAGHWSDEDQLGSGIVSAAIDAASAESCGSEIEPAELGRIAVSVCVLGAPRTPEHVDEELVLGADVVVIQRGDLRGWLYPSLAVEQRWSPAEYLERTCRTAGLHPDEWTDDRTTVRLYPGQVFNEREPAGEVERGPVLSDSAP